MVQVTTIAGSGARYQSVDGIGMAARFHNPSYVCANETHLFVSDTGSTCIRRIDLATNAVTTLAGSLEGYADGIEIGRAHV